LLAAVFCLGAKNNKMSKIKLTDEVVVPVMEKHKVSREEAEKRIQLLYQSGILINGTADDYETQRLIDGFLAQDSEELAETVAFEICFTKCLEDENLIKEYDRLRPKAHLAYSLKQIEGNKMNVKEQREVKKQLEMFEKFVREYIFSRLEPSADRGVSANGS
jgi:hypothetical protein